MTMSTVISKITAVAEAEGYCSRLMSFWIIKRPYVGGLAPGLMKRTVMKSPITKGHNEDGSDHDPRLGQGE